MAVSATLLSEIEDAFDAMSNSLRVFDERLYQSSLSISLPWVEEHGLQKQIARELYNDLWHKDHQDGRKTTTNYGLVGANESLILAAKHLNHHKARLKTVIANLKKSELSQLHEHLHKRSIVLANSLNQTGLARLHLKQCYRQIPLLESRPDSVRFSWYSSGRSIRKLSVEEAMGRLLKLDISQPHIQIQLEKLSALHQATPLAQIQQQVPVIRANFAWKTTDNHWQRQARNCPLPILIPLNEGDTLPEHNILPTAPPEQRNRAQRSDSKIDPTPFLSSLRIHLYRN